MDYLIRAPALIRRFKAIAASNSMILSSFVTYYIDRRKMLLPRLTLFPVKAN